MTPFELIRKDMALCDSLGALSVCWGKWQKDMKDLDQADRAALTATKDWHKKRLQGSSTRATMRR